MYKKTLFELFTSGKILGIAFFQPLSLCAEIECSYTPQAGEDTLNFPSDKVIANDVFQRHIKPTSIQSTGLVSGISVGTSAFQHS